MKRTHPKVVVEKAAVRIMCKLYDATGGQPQRCLTDDGRC
jgi:hypothetical protein